MLNVILIETGETIFISSEEYKQNKHLYKFFTTGLVTARNTLTGETLKVTKSEFDSNPDLVGPNANQEKRIRVYDRTANIEKVVKVSLIDEFMKNNPDFKIGGRPKKN